MEGSHASSLVQIGVKAFTVSFWATSAESLGTGIEALILSRTNDRIATNVHSALLKTVSKYLSPITLRSLVHRCWLHHVGFVALGTDLSLIYISVMAWIYLNDHG